MLDDQSALATLNGVRIPIANGGASRLDQLIIGEEARAASGSDLSSIRAIKEGWRFKLAPLSPIEAGRWRALLGPHCFSWSFDDSLYSDLRGLGPDVSTGLSINSSVQKYGAGSLNVAPSVNSTFFLGNGIAHRRWTLMWWIRRGATWHHWTKYYEINVDGTDAAEGTLLNGVDQASVPDDATKFAFWAQAVKGILSFDGERQILLRYPGATPAAPFTNWSAVESIGGSVARKNVDGGQSAGSAWFIATNTGTTGGSEPTWDVSSIGALTNDNGVLWAYQGSTTLQIDDMVFLPTSPGDGWLERWYALHSTIAWPTAPKYRLSGAVTAWMHQSNTFTPPDRWTTVQGRVLPAKLSRASISGDPFLDVATEELELEFREA